jgi:hypothetical protein
VCEERGRHFQWRPFFCWPGGDSYRDLAVPH